MWITTVQVLKLEFSSPSANFATRWRYVIHVIMLTEQDKLNLIVFQNCLDNY